MPGELAEKGLNVLKADPVMLKECRSQLERIKNLFPLEEVPEKPKRKPFRKLLSKINFCFTLIFLFFINWENNLWFDCFFRRGFYEDDDNGPVSTSLFKTGSTSSSIDSDQDLISSLRQNLPANGEFDSKLLRELVILATT